MNSFVFWVSTKFVFRGKNLNLPTVLALVGLVIGVATLVLGLSVVSGVQSFLKSAVIDVSGHVMLMKPGGITQPYDTIVPEIKAVTKGFVAATPFVHLEALAVKDGKTQSAMIQGLDTTTVHNVLALKDRLIDGEFNLSEVEGKDGAVIGKELAKKFKIKIGDDIQVVIPRPLKTDTTGFQPAMRSLRVTGILDLGKYEYNDRVVAVSDLVAQQLAGIGNIYSGLRIKLTDSDLAVEAGEAITEKLGHPYWVKDWRETNSNFFQAVEKEKEILFYVLSIIVVIASLNVASLLLVNVLKRYQDISVLKALGATRKDVVSIFILHGLVLGVFGSLVGVILGVGLSFLVSKKGLIDVPAEVYKFDHLPIEFRVADLAIILALSFVLCLFSTLIPAWKGARLSPVEGLKYE